MIPNNSVYRRIEREVSSLLAKNEVENYPVPVEKIARSLGIEVVAHEVGDELSGMLVLNEGQGTIVFNAAHSKGRQRFTIAHELGHFVLHGDTKQQIFLDKDYIVVKYRGRKEYSKTELQHETEANTFAAQLLMPKELIINELQRNELMMLTEYELIDHLAKVFEVSVPAMTFRLSNLNIS